MEEKDILNSPASQKNLLQIAQIGFLDARAYERALRIIGFTPNTNRWNRFLNTFLLVLGAAFTVSGIYFFFAYNWADMHRFVKLGIIEMFILGLVIFTSVTSLEKLTGKITLTVAGVLIGALLAVFGQIYQTGADSYTLFMYWALFMTGWVFISRFTPMWFIWILLINISIFFYWDQILEYSDDPMLWLIGVFVNGVFILLWEFFAPKTDWLISRWTPRTLSAAVYYITTVAAVFFVTGEDEANKNIYILILTILFVLINATVLYVYSQKNLDMFMLTISAISLMIVMNIWLADIMERIWTDEFALLFFAVIIIVQTTLVVTLLLRASKSWEARKQE